MGLTILSSTRHRSTHVLFL